MLKNYFKMAYRKAFNLKSHSLFNLFGLTIGMTASFMILFYVVHELNYNSFHKNGEEIYKISGSMKYSGMDIQFDGMSPAFGPKMKEEDPRVLDYIRMMREGKATVGTDGGDTFFESEILFADPQFFDLLDFPIKLGSVKNFTDENQVLLTQALASKYFGETNPIGQSLTYNKDQVLNVVGIVEDAPSNSTIDFSMIISFNTLGNIESTKAQYENTKVQLGSFKTFLKIEKSASIDEVIATMQEFNESEGDNEFYLEPITELHLGKFSNPAELIMIYIFASLGGIILLLALVNYANLSIAKATARAKEVAVRKVVGAGKASLLVQFYIESFMVVGFAVVLSLLLTFLLLPNLTNFLDIDLGREWLFSTPFLILIAAITILSIVLSGSYPAIVMSRFKTINAMKGNLGGKSSSGWLQKIFTSFQFTISICLVMATIVVLSQTSYLKNQETGFDKDQIMVMTLDQEASNKISYIKNELQQYAAVQKIAAANTAIYQGGSAIYFTKIPDTEEDINLSYMAVDENFPELLGLEWIAKKNETAVKSGIIINEMAMEELRLSSEDFSVDLQLGRGNSEVTGVVKDFNYSSSKQPIRPLAMKIISDSLAGQLGAEPSLYLKLSHIENWLEIVKNVEEYYKKAMPDTPFEYYFLDDAFAETLAQERKLGTLLSIFAGLGIVIAGLGLLGLVTFSLERRVKEIGIRKVLGATVSQIIILISRNYLGIMIISATLAIPISWWGLNKWLTNFSNHIDVEIWMALTSTGLILLVGFATVALRTLGASKLNPVDTLRAE